jgi:hypothetical protein
MPLASLAGQAGIDPSTVHDMGTILIAAGGGGDAITSAALRRALNLAGPLVIMSYAWDRLMIDPLPGPRTTSDFNGLRELRPGVYEVLPESQARPPAGSSLPRLANELDARILLLDPVGGAVGMAQQIAGAAEFFAAGDAVLVDVGGDSLTTGNEPGLRSPLADQLAIAACLRSQIPTTLVIPAPGVDGELEFSAITARLKGLHARRLPELTSADLDPIRRVFSWHPSEASGLLAAATFGHRGYVEVRDAGDHVALTDETPSVHAIDLTAVTANGATAPGLQLTETASLADAEAAIERITGINELRYERAKAARRDGQPSHQVTAHDLDTVDKHAAQAAGRGADYISLRRLAELIGAHTLDNYAALSQLLAETRAERYGPSIYRVAEHGSN